MSNEDEVALDEDEPTVDDAEDADVEATDEADGDAEGADADADADSTTSADEPPEDGLQHDDFVKLDYTAKTVEDGRLVDTTRESVAEEEGLDLDEHDFEPRVIVLGAGHLFQRVEEDIVGKDVGDTGSVVIESVEAFGEYDPNDVRTVSVDKIPEDDRYPGAHVDIDGQHGHVETVIGGRARVDFNHPLAGEDIEYDYEIVDVVDDPIEQARGFLGMFFDVDLDMWLQSDEVEEEVPVEPDDESDEDADGEPETEMQTVEYETLYIESNPMLTFNQEWLFQKRRLAQELIDRLAIDRVIVQEIIEGEGGMFGGMGDLDALGLDESAEDLDVDADELVDELEGELDEAEAAGEAEEPGPVAGDEE